MKIILVKNEIYDIVDTWMQSSAQEKRTKTMTTQNNKYRGWTNRATWLVALHIDSNEHDQALWADEVALAYEHAEAEEHFTKEENAWLWVSEHLEEWVESSIEAFENVTLEDASMPIGDLLSVAAGEVNYHEIAQNWISEHKIHLEQDA
jgi:hypothetical protein